MANKIKDSWKSRFYKDVEKHPERVFRDLHKDLPRFVKLLKRAGAKNVLDLGCGTGKHTVALAKGGFRVFGFDLVETAVKVVQDWLKKEWLGAELRVGDMYKKLPYKDNFFDGIISTKVLHHGTLPQIKKLVKELERVMRPGGILMVEVPRNKRGYKRFKGKYKEIGQGLIVPTAGPEKGVPHYILSSKKELADLFPNFKVISITITGMVAGMANSRNHYTLLGRLKKY